MDITMWLLGRIIAEPKIAHDDLINEVCDAIRDLETSGKVKEIWNPSEIGYETTEHGREYFEANDRR